MPRTTADASREAASEDGSPAEPWPASYLVATISAWLRWCSASVASAHGSLAVAAATSATATSAPAASLAASTSSQAATASSAEATPTESASALATSARALASAAALTRAATMFAAAAPTAVVAALGAQGVGAAHDVLAPRDGLRVWREPLLLGRDACRLGRVPRRPAGARRVLHLVALRE